MKKLFPRGFSLLELFITIMIMGIIAGGLVAMKSSFEHRRQLESSASKLQQSLRQAQTYSMGAGGNYRHYGVLFYENIGVDDNNDGFRDRQGWKIVCYCQITAGKCTAPIVVPPPLAANATFEVIASSEEADNADLFENTFFAERVTIDASSPFQIGERIVFTEQKGSATCDGTNLLGTPTCPDTDIVLTAFGRTVPLHITPLTGHVQMQ